MLVSCGSWSMADALDMTWRSKVASVPSCNLNRCMSSALYHEAVFSSGVQRGIVWTSTDGENDTPLLRRLLVGFVRRSIGWDVTLSVVDDSETIEDDDAWPQSLLLHKLQSSLLFFKGRDIWDDAMSTIFDGTNELETSTSWQDWGAIFVDNNELSAVMVIEHIVIVHQGLRLWFTRKFRRWLPTSECVMFSCSPCSWQKKWRGKALILRCWRFSAQVQLVSFYSVPQSSFWAAQQFWCNTHAEVVILCKCLGIIIHRYL